MPVINCQQYNAPIAIMQKQEKVLVHEANDTTKRGTLMVITTRYRHINSNLRGEIQDQRDCYLINKWDAKTDRAWKKFHFMGYGGVK